MKLYKLLVPAAIILLGFFSLMFRKVAGFPLEGAGADLSAMSVSLQLSFIMTRDLTATIQNVPAIYIDILLFCILLILWGYTISVVQGSLSSDNPIEIQTLSRKAILLGFLTITLEFYWRINFG